MGVGALGLVGRGFDTVVKPSLERPLAETGCISCGQCVTVCPTGALQERQSVVKEVPLDTKVTDTTCSFCSVGCGLHLESYGDMLIKSNPDKTYRLSIYLNNLYVNQLMENFNSISNTYEQQVGRVTDKTINIKRDNEIGVK